MAKNNSFLRILVVLLTILLIGAVAFIVYFQLNDSNQSSEPTVNEILEATWKTEEITTNLASNDVIRIQFSIQLDNKKTKEEIVKRDFQVYNIIINELSTMENDQFNDKNGLKGLEERLTAEINQLLQHGEVERIYTTQKIIQ